MSDKRLLPPDQRRIEVEVGPDGELMLAVGFYESGNYRLWTPIPFSEFSHDLTCLDDLERRVIQHVDTPPVSGE